SSSALLRLERSRCGAVPATRRLFAPRVFQLRRCCSRSCVSSWLSIKSCRIPSTACGDSASCSRACRFISSGDVFMRVIDFHNHYYPPKYMQALQSGQSSVKVTIDKDGNPNLHYPGDYNVAARGPRELAYRQEVRDTHGVTRQVVTLTTPGTHVESPATAAKLASLVNDEFKEARETRGPPSTAS